MKNKFLSPWLMTFILGFGMFMFSSTDLSAQAETVLVQRIDKMITKYSGMQQAYAEFSPKWEVFEELVSHLQNVRTAVSNSSTYLDYNSDALNPEAPLFKKTHPSILYPYTTNQLAQLQARYDFMTVEGQTSLPAYKKIKYVLEVNGLL